MELFEEHTTKRRRGKVIIVILLLACAVRVWDIHKSIGFLAQGDFELLPRSFFVFAIIIDVLFILFCIPIFMRKKWGIYVLGGILVIQAVVPFLFTDKISTWFFLPSLVGTPFVLIIIYVLWVDYE